MKNKKGFITAHKNTVHTFYAYLEEVIEAPPEEEEEEPRVTNFNIPIKEIEKRFRALVKLVDGLVVRDCDHNHLGDFLPKMVDECRQAWMNILPGILIFMEKCTRKASF